jgi:ADP-heptose:LPS heptosyltransferase
VAQILLRLLGMVRKKRPLPSGIERIGLMKTAGIGDVVLLCAIAHDLLQSFPAARLVVVAGPENAAMAELIPGAEVVRLPTAKPWQAVPLLRAAKLDVLLDFGQWTRVEALYTALSGARWHAGFDTPGQRRAYAYDLAVPHRPEVPEIENYRALVAGVGVRAISDPRFDAPHGVAAPTEEPYAVLHLWPGGFRSELREWPAERWRELAGQLAAGGLMLVLTGGPGDRERTEAFIASCGETAGRMVSVAGRYRLPELVGVLAAARCVISVNTGVMHMAAAAGARTIALNGPTSSLRWGPIGPEVVNLDSELAGCGFLNLGFEYEGQRLDCMAGISVERVLAATQEPVDA